MNETLNFKSSMGINKLIIDFAREQILIHNNVEKAIETITKSINCSRDIAKDLLIGNKVLIQDKDNSSNLCGTSQNSITVNKLKSFSQEQLAEIFN